MFPAAVRQKQPTKTAREQTHNPAAFKTFQGTTLIPGIYWYLVRVKVHSRGGVFFVFFFRVRKSCFSAVFFKPLFINSYAREKNIRAVSWEEKKKKNSAT